MLLFNEQSMYACVLDRKQLIKQERKNVTINIVIKITINAILYLVRYDKHV